MHGTENEMAKICLWVKLKNELYSNQILKLTLTKPLVLHELVVVRIHVSGT